MDREKTISNSPEDTKAEGKRLGIRLIKGDTVCLYGELGSGKTTFIKGIGEALGIPEREISSASFIIVSEHEAKIPFYHIDLYRIEKPEDIDSTGIYDYVMADGITVIEWAERLPVIEGCIKVMINFISEGKREIVIEGKEFFE